MDPDETPRNSVSQQDPNYFQNSKTTIRARFDCQLNLPFISYKFVKRFLAITFFYSFLFLAETYMICINVFHVLRNELLVWSNKNGENIPYIPFVKIAHFGNIMSIDMTLAKLAIFTMGIYGEILCLLSENWARNKKL